MATWNNIGQDCKMACSGMICQNCTKLVARLTEYGRSKVLQMIMHRPASEAQRRIAVVASDTINRVGVNTTRPSSGVRRRRSTRGK